MENCTVHAKTCTKCGIEKPLERFSPGQGRHGCRSQCKDCKRRPRKPPRAPRAPETHKTCSKCASTLPISEFRKGRVCRPCNSLIGRARYAANPERERQRVHAATLANPEATRARKARRRALKLQATIAPFTAEQERQRALVWGDRCWMCRGDWSAWDHVKPLVKGGAHCLANLRPACTSCNSRKGSQWRGVDQLHRFLL